MPDRLIENTIPIVGVASMAASVVAIHRGCSPWSCRCTDKLVVIKVRVDAIRRASARK